jgi:hypothetical protein
MDHEPHFVVAKEISWEEFVRIFYSQRFVVFNEYKWWDSKDSHMWNIHSRTGFFKAFAGRIDDLSECDQIIIFNGCFDTRKYEKKFNERVKVDPSGLFLLHREKWEKNGETYEDCDGYEHDEYAPTGEVNPRPVGVWFVDQMKPKELLEIFNKN